LFQRLRPPSPGASALSHHAASLASAAKASGPLSPSNPRSRPQSARALRGQRTTAEPPPAVSVFAAEQGEQPQQCHVGTVGTGSSFPNNPGAVPDPPPGGLTGTLLASLKGTQPTDAMDLRLLEAAVMRAAPSKCVLPCNMGVCCWRWAARQLLHECAVARAEAIALRAAFEEEVGNSVQQKLLDLQSRHHDLESRHDTTVTALDKWRGRCDASERQCREALAAKERAEKELQQSEDTQRQLGAALTKAKSKLEDTEEELRVLRAHRGVESLKQKWEEAEARCDEISERLTAQISKLREELDKANDEAATKGVRIKQLEALETSAQQVRRAARRDKKHRK